MGLDGRAFTVYKFRSMSYDAEVAMGPVVAAPADLDELPSWGPGPNVRSSWSRSSNASPRTQDHGRTKKRGRTQEPWTKHQGPASQAVPGSLISRRSRKK
jgi:hypothetical protein